MLRRRAPGSLARAAALALRRALPWVLEGDARFAASASAAPAQGKDSPGQEQAR